jgi:hypothetical protein
MQVKVIIDCENCLTRREEILKEGTNKVSGCNCPYPYGDDGGTITVKTDRS